MIFFLFAFLCVSVVLCAVVWRPIKAKTMLSRGNDVYG